MAAFLIRLPDAEHQEYVQKNPFLNGPDRSLNSELRRAWRVHLEARDLPRASFSHEESETSLDHLLAPDDKAAVARVCAEIGIDAAERERIVNVWGWKVARAPRSARRILSIGCGAGHELVVLRALFPDADLQGVDYEVVVPSAWRTALKLGELRRQHIEDYLSAHRGAFDLVFSNHTLEHLSYPDRTLRLVREAIAPGGSFVSALPLEADESNPFYRELLAVAEGRGEFDAHLDFELINPSHAWKSNREDLAATVHAAGFRDIRMFTRANYPSYYQPPMHVSGLKRARTVGRLLENLTLRPLRRGLRRAYPREMPPLAVRAYYTIAGRCWFSRLRLIHNLMHEVLVVATTAADAT
jgi:SAM-dependent methyltransferase